MPELTTDRRGFLRAAGTAALAYGLGPRRARASNQPPNIIFIYADDLDFDELSPYDINQFPCWTGAKAQGLSGEGQWSPGFADPRMLTPNLQRLADEGATFNRFYITTPICTPSRYAALTGRYASRSPRFCQSFPPGGPCSIRWNTPLSPGERHAGNVLREFGYATGMVGKWHNGQTPKCKARQVPNDADPTDPPVAAAVRAAQQVATAYLREQMGWDYAERIYVGNKEEIGGPDALKVHNLEWLTQGALEFIDRYHSQPFFLYLPLTIPHAQYHPGMLNGDPRATPAGIVPQAPQVQPSRDSVRQRLEAAGIDQRNAAATWLDDAVGALLRRVADLGLDEQTAVLFTSDHQSRGKDTCYEAARVPALLRWPGAVEPGSRVDGLCANLDLLPTFAEMAGRPLPTDCPVDGQSFLGQLQGRADAPRREALLLECSNSRAAITERWKLLANRPPQAVLDRMAAEAAECARTGARRQIAWDGQQNPHPQEKGIRYGADRDFPAYFDADQVFDLDEDVFEQHNLVADPAAAQTTASLRQQLSRLLAPLPHTFGEFRVG